MSSKHARMMKRIKEHGENLGIIFPERSIKEPVQLCKALRKLERKAAAVALDLCNGD